MTAVRRIDDVRASGLKGCRRPRTDMSSVRLGARNLTFARIDSERLFSPPKAVRQHVRSGAWKLTSACSSPGHWRPSRRRIGFGPH